MEESMFVKLISILIVLSGCSGLKTKQQVIDVERQVSIFPGEILKVKTLTSADFVKCDNEKLFPVEISNNKYYFFAESYFSQRESVTCEIFHNHKKVFSQNIVVGKKEYPFETLSVSPRRVKLSKKDLERVIKERKTGITKGRNTVKKAKVHRLRELKPL